MVRSNLYVNPQCKNPDETLRELKLGYLNIKDGLFDLAQTNFDMVIVSDKTCSDAFWGLVLCRLEVKDENVFLAEPKKYTSIFQLKEYQNARKFANAEQKARLNNMLKLIPGFSDRDDDEEGKKKAFQFNYNPDEIY